MMDMMASMGLWALILLMVLLVGIAGAVYLGVRAARGAPPPRDPAREELSRRLASGEIDLDEYYERDAALREAHAIRR